MEATDSPKKNSKWTSKTTCLKFTRSRRPRFSSRTTTQTDWCRTVIRTKQDRKSSWLRVTRLVKIFAETDDREASVFKPVCSLVSPMIADRLLESPLHAARFVSLIPFQRLEAPGADRVEVWHSMQSFLARVSVFSLTLSGMRRLGRPRCSPVQPFAWVWTRCLRGDRHKQ